MKIIWCMVPEIWSMMNRIFSRSWSFFALLPPWQLEKLKFWKIAKKPGDIIILHMCTINDNHMMYGYWDMKCEKQNFQAWKCYHFTQMWWMYNCYFSFWAIFCPLTPLPAQKIKIWKEWKNLLKISSFSTCLPKIMIRWCTVS